MDINKTNNHPICDLDPLRYSHETIGIPIDKTTAEYAAIQGNLSCLKYALDHIGELAIKCTICNYAAAGGQVDCLRYAHEHGCLLDMWAYLEVTTACHHVAEPNLLACLQYLYNHGCRCPKYIGYSSLNSSIKTNRLECARFIHETVGIEFAEECVINSINNDNVGCLKYIHESGYKLSKYKRTLKNPACVSYLDKFGMIYD